MNVTINLHKKDKDIFAFLWNCKEYFLESVAKMNDEIYNRIRKMEFNLLSEMKKELCLRHYDVTLAELDKIYHECKNYEFDKEGEDYFWFQEFWRRIEDDFGFFLGICWV